MAASYLTPGVFIEEIPSGARPIQSVGSSTAGFVGEAPDPGVPTDRAVAVDSWAQFLARFAASEKAAPTMLAQGVYGFFLNGGGRCYVANVGKGGSLTGGAGRRAGLDLLEQVDEVAIVAAPGYSDPASHGALIDHCEKMKDRVAVLDPPREIPDLGRLKVVATAVAGSKGSKGATEGEGADPSARAGGLRPRQSDGGYAAFYVPWITVRDPLAPDQLIDVPPSGHLAGIYARSDALRGVHKAPANEVVRGALNVAYNITPEEQGELNQAGVNCIRLFSREGIRVWGARTLAAASSEWRYLNVRRLFNMIEESIAQNTRWVVFEPNDVSLWKAIRRDVSAFLMTLWRDGALAGASPEAAFFVKCDAETNPPEVIDQGRVVIVIGVAPVKPAEFVIFRIGQHAAGAEID
jgi:phage tail sheath protein FI